MGSKRGSEPLDEGTIHDILRNDRRRLTIESLRDSDDVVEISDLVEAIVAAGLSVGLTVAAASHVYSQQDRVVFQRALR